MIQLCESIVSIPRPLYCVREPLACRALLVRTFSVFMSTVVPQNSAASSDCLAPMLEFCQLEETHNQPI
jgi:hypothetical protein